MDTIVYSTSTGSAPVDLRPDAPVQEEDTMTWEPEPFCFVCSRCTDHFAEHDDLVEAGLAHYGEDGTVYRGPAPE